MIRLIHPASVAGNFHVTANARLLAFALGLLSSVCSSLSGATVVTKNSPVPLFGDGYGYNTRFPDTAEPWEYSNNLWTLAYGETFASCLRYPGGTVGSFWNGQTDKLLTKKTSADPNGWIDTAKVGFSDITSVVIGNTQQINSLSDLKTVVTATGATPLFVLNLVTPGKDFYASAQGWNRTINDHPGIAYNASNPDDWYKLLDARYALTKQILIKAHAQGIPITRIELGNEYYLANSTYYQEAFPDNSTYATAGACYAIAANYVANKLLTDPQLSFLPSNVSLSVPGATEKVSFNSTRILNWNSQMTGVLNSSVIKNVTMHSYQEADTTITTFTAANVETNVATWLANINQTLQDKNAYPTIVNANTPYNVWWDELSPTQATGVKAQWGGVLAQVFMGLWAADNKGVVFMHPNLDGPFVVDDQTGNLKQIAYGMMPLMQATSSCTKAYHLNFPGLPKLGTSVRTVLQGQYFEDASGNVRKCCILSFSDVPITLDLTGVFSGLSTLTISGEQNSSPNLTGNPVHMGNQTSTANSVVIQPYSVNFIRPDTTAPVIAIPANITTEAMSPAGTVVMFNASATDDSDGIVPVTCTPSSGSTFPLGTTTVVATATDLSGNTSTKTFTVTVRDTTAPALTLPANLVLEATSAAGAVANFTATAVDTVSGSTPVTLNPSSGSTFPLGVTTVTASATDAAGNTATGSFTVTIVDTTPPTISVPANLVFEATGPAGAIATYTAAASDSVSGTEPVNFSLPSGSTFPLGTKTVTATATDAAGNTATASFTVTVRDTTPPVIHVPANQLLEATGPAGAVAIYSATANDLVSGAVPVNFSIPAGSTFPLGATSMTATATDAAGNTATATFTITVVDTTPPVIAVPADQALETTGPNGATATFSATAHDLVSGDVAVTFDHASGSTFPIGTSVVTAMAFDAAGNKATNTFKITVRDTTPPVLSLPANLTAEATSAAGASVSFNASANDLVSGNVAVTFDHAPGSTFPIGTTTVTARATDAAGNTTTSTFTVTVRDTTPPTIQSLVASPAALWPANHKLVAVTVTAQAVDLVDASPTVRIVSVTSNEPINGPGDGNTAPDWEITGPMTLNLRAERAGNLSSRIYTITVVATDSFGNTSTKQVNVIVPHNQ